MTKKPKVFANQIDKNIKNNKEVFDSTKEEFKEIETVSFDQEDKINDITIADKITQLLSKTGYIFNVDVLIITKDGEFNTHIASVVNNHIITMDNDIINLDDVIDIKY